MDRLPGGFRGRLAASFALLLAATALLPARGAGSWLALLALALALVWAVGGSLAGPVRDMGAWVKRLAGGDYAARVRDLPEDEHGDLGRALNDLAERIQASVTELSGDRAQLSSILENIVEAVAAVDPDGNLIALNPAL